MIVFHSHPLSLNGLKVHLVLEEAGRPFQAVVVDLEKRASLKSSTLQMNPLGRVPFIDDDGFILGESSAIMRYLADKWELTDLYPRPPQERALCDEWLDFTAQHVNHPLSVVYLARWFVRRQEVEGWGIDVSVQRSALLHLARNFRILEARLRESPFLAGHKPTLADLGLAPFIAVAPGIRLSLDDFPNIARWREHMLARDSFRRVADPRLPLSPPARESAPEASFLG